MFEDNLTIKHFVLIEADAAKTNDSTCSLLTDCRNFEQLGQVDTASLTGQMSQTSRGIMELASTTRSGESESDSHCCFQTKDKQLCPLSAATCRPSRQRHVVSCSQLSVDSTHYYLLSVFCSTAGSTPRTVHTDAAMFTVIA